MLKRGSVFGWLLAVSLVPMLSWATDAIPVCPAFNLKRENGGKAGNLPVNNDQVLAWKRAGRQDPRKNNAFLGRGHVLGEIVRVYPDRNGHEHFSIKIGSGDDDTVEIVYNQHFGHVPDPKIGMPVEACGDYITSVAPTPNPQGGMYPASPDGALVHYVHAVGPNSAHHSGYLMVNGVLTGQQISRGGSRPPRDDWNHNDGNAPGIDLDGR